MMLRNQRETHTTAHRLVNGATFETIREGKLVLLSALVLVQLGSSCVAWAWNLTGHRSIALDALTTLPLPKREALTPHDSALLAGLLEPDFNRLVSLTRGLESRARRPRSGPLQGRMERVAPKESSRNHVSA